MAHHEGAHTLRPRERIQEAREGGYGEELALSFQIDEELAAEGAHPCSQVTAQALCQLPSEAHTRAHIRKLAPLLNRWRMCGLISPCRVQQSPRSTTINSAEGRARWSCRLCAPAATRKIRDSGRSSSTPLEGSGADCPPQNEAPRNARPMRALRWRALGSTESYGLCFASCDSEWRRHWEQKWFRFTFIPVFDDNGDTDIRWQVDPERSGTEEAEDIHCEEHARRLPKAAAAALAKEWYDNHSEFAGTYKMVLPPRNIYHPHPRNGEPVNHNVWSVSFETEPSSLSEAFLQFEVASRYTMDHDAVQWVMVKYEENELLHRFQERDEQILLDRAQKACPPPSVLAQAEEIEHATLRKGVRRAKLKGLVDLGGALHLDVHSPSSKLKHKAEKEKNKHIEAWYQKKVADTVAPDGVVGAPAAMASPGGHRGAGATAGQRIRSNRTHYGNTDKDSHYGGGKRSVDAPQPERKMVALHSYSAGDIWTGDVCESTPWQLAKRATLRGKSFCNNCLVAPVVS